MCWLETGHRWIMLRRPLEARGCKWACAKSLYYTLPGQGRGRRGLLSTCVCSFAITMSLEAESRLDLGHNPSSHSVLLLRKSFFNVLEPSVRQLSHQSLPFMERQGALEVSVFFGIVPSSCVCDSDYLMFLPKTNSWRLITSIFWTLPFQVHPRSLMARTFPCIRLHCYTRSSGPSVDQASNEETGKEWPPKAQPPSSAPQFLDTLGKIF